MLKNFLKYIIFLMLTAFIPFGNLKNERAKDYSFEDLFPIHPQGKQWVDSVFNSLSLRQKCAQLVVPYGYGNDTAEFSKNYDRMKKLVEEENVGGILFLSGDSKDQTIIINKLQQLSNVPLLISADYERGVGSRLDDAVEFPYQMAFAAAGNPYLDYLAGKITGTEARSLGVHQNYAPLVDVVHDYRNPIINIRSYSSNPSLIEYHSSAFMRGLHESKMISTAKHFPGHGGTDVDTHTELALVKLSRNELLKNDVATFKYVIDRGIKSVMIGHLDVPALSGTKNIPATFSYDIVTGLLKNKLGFNGLVVTDALNMWSVTNNYTQADAGVLALQAGNDILLFPKDEKEMIDGLVNAVNKGRLKETRIEESVKKILAAKYWLGLNNYSTGNYKKASKELGNKTHGRIAQTVAERSITLIKDEDNLVPLEPDKYKNKFMILFSDNRYRSRDDKDYPFTEEINRRLGYVKNYEVIYEDDSNKFEQILNDLKKADLIILPLFSSVKSFQGTVDLHENQLDFINDIIDLDKPTVAISFGNPFLLTEIPGLPTYIAAYGNVHISQYAAVNALLGNIKISGNLPVDIPKTKFRKGRGIHRESKGLFFQEELVDTNYDFSTVDSLMNDALIQKMFPGAVLLVGHRNRVVYHKPFGHFTYDKNARKVDLNSIFDLASLTKVVATTSAVMTLYDKGKLQLDDKVVDYLPAFGNKGKEIITIKNLLLHNSGLPAWKPFYRNYSNPEDVIHSIMFMDLDFQPGEKYQYSDLGIIVLQKVIETITGKTLDEYVKEAVFDPLNMNDSFFNPSPKVWYDVLPTEYDRYWRMKQLKGQVHDETAYLLGGVAGHAGLFSTAKDLSKLVYTLLNKGKYGSKRLFKEGTVELFTTKQSSLNGRALGWDTKEKENSSAGSLFSYDSFGHTGFTGTSIWADKDEGLFVILLTNRVYPTRENRKLIGFRPVLHDAVYEAVTSF